MASGVLVHLTDPPTWRAALSEGVVTPPSLRSEGFVHLSAPEHLQVPANAFYAGRPDLVALAVDPARLPGELRFEAAHDPAAGGMRFPHHYGPLPTSAVLAVVPYPPGPDGRFGTPTGLPGPDDTVARVRGFDRWLAQRRATASDQLDAQRLDGRRLRELRLLTCPPATPRPEAPVITVDHEMVGPFWERAWRRERPDADEETVRRLLVRDASTDAVLRVVHLAVLDERGDPVAAGRLLIDGATASIAALVTEPGHRRRGLGGALLRQAVALARTAGCDLVFVAAAADGWPYRWYRRLGWTDVHTRYEKPSGPLDSVTLPRGTG